MTDLLEVSDLLLVSSAPFVGSFLGLLAHRLPGGERIVFDRSHCPHCSATLRPLDLIPLASWLVRRGRCQYCATPLGAFYPAIELASLLIAIASVMVLPGWLALAGCGFGWILLTLAVIDFRCMLLPNELTLPLVPGGLIVTWVNDSGTLPDHAVGAVLGFVLLAAISWLYRCLRAREGLGMGDAKLVAGIGAWVGWLGLPGVVLYGAMSGLALAVAESFAGRPLELGRRVAFGPHLCLGGWIVWLSGPVYLG